MCRYLVIGCRHDLDHRVDEDRRLGGEQRRQDDEHNHASDVQVPRSPPGAGRVSPRATFGWLNTRGARLRVGRIDVLARANAPTLVAFTDAPEQPELKPGDSNHRRHNESDRQHYRLTFSPLECSVDSIAFAVRDRRRA